MSQQEDEEKKIEEKYEVKIENRTLLSIDVNYG